MANFIHESYLSDKSICDKIISLFKANNEKTSGKISLGGVDKKIKDSTDLCISIDNAINNQITNLYLDLLQEVCEEYIKKYPMCNDYSPWTINETINIQHYKPTQGYHAWHTEREGRNDLTSVRHLVFMTYLNDVNDGGETEFLHQNIKIKPKKGKTIIWPADWTHTHRGKTSPTEDKYIITGWYSFYNK